MAPRLVLCFVSLFSFFSPLKVTFSLLPGDSFSFHNFSKFPYLFVCFFKWGHKTARRAAIAIAIFSCCCCCGCSPNGNKLPKCQWTKVSARGGRRWQTLRRGFGLLSSTKFNEFLGRKRQQQIVRKRFSISCQTLLGRLAIFMRAASEICPNNASSRQGGEGGGVGGSSPYRLRRWSERTFILLINLARVFVQLAGWAWPGQRRCLCVYLGPD